MPELSPRRSWIFAVDALLIGVALLGVYRLQSKARLPAMFVESEQGFVVERTLTPQADTTLMAGDILVAVDGARIYSYNEIEFLTDHHLPWQFADVTVLRAGREVTYSLALVRHFTPFQVAIHGIVAGLYIFLGILVLVKRRGSELSLVFHWLVILAALKTVSVWASYTIQPTSLGYILQWVNLFADALVPALALHFSFIFPRVKGIGGTRYMVIPYLVATALIIWMSVTFAAAINPPDIEAFRRFLPSFTVARVLLSVTFVGVGINLAHSYITAREEQDKRKIMWTVPGLVIGPMTYIFLWVVPMMLISESLIPVELLMLTLAIFPITFAIAIVRHNAFDIVLLFNRSTAATLILGASLAVYALVVGIISALVQTFTVQSSLFATGAAAAVVVLIFEPTRRMVTHFVDRTFFRTQFSYREAQKRFISRLPKCIDAREVAQVIVEELDGFLLLRRIAVFGTVVEQGTMQLLDHRNLEPLPGGRLPLDLNESLAFSTRPMAIAAWVETDADSGAAPEEAFAQMGMVLGVPMLTEDGGLLGVILLSRKKSGQKYSRREVDLLEVVGTQASLAIERILMHQKLVLEKAESRRLEELNNMKSYFVSSVSHDLKTPLTSIRLFAEMMRTGELPEDKVQDFCRIIEGETDRLTRLINNVLDFAKIEKGIKEYHFSEIDLNGLVAHVMHSLEYQFQLNDFVTEQKLDKNEIVVNADADAVIEVLVNLLANSMKYVADKRVIQVATYMRNGTACLAVTDEGIGIPPEMQSQIFDPFIRAATKNSAGPPGAGLGLSVVKHVMEAHHGSIDLDSTPGKGSTFILVFPSEAPA
ncbi:MAG: GAF domain-containing protein [Candidatus Marinimicrobia bacterium]|nr:GAF domain-containing protein [Candidatus Neomarinimicrobiota bacterium]